MVKVGIVGVGFMGMIHYLSYQKLRGVQVAALCEKTHTHRLGGDWRDVKGNFGPAGARMDLTGVDTHTELAEMLANPEIDLVDICLPPGLHALAAQQALRAGKHVFCEKPMALTTLDCRRMVAAAEKAQRLLFIGHVLPFFPEYHKARQLIESGRYGRLLGGSFKRVISDPAWLPDYYKPDRVGGPMLDLHIHDAHFIRLLFGMPESVSTQGRMRGEVLEYWNTQFRFADPRLVVSATSGVIDQPSRPFLHGFEIHLERATLVMEFGVVGEEGRQMMPLTVLPAKGKPQAPKLRGGDPVEAFEAELKEVVRCVSKNEPSPVLGAELARDAIVICQKETQSAVRGRAVKV